jgi:ComF family protein
MRYTEPVERFVTLPGLRCVFRRDSGSLTIDVPPSETTRWRAIVRVLRSPVDAVGCALLPASCFLCGTPLPQLSSVPICDVCWAGVPALEDDAACPQCGDTLDRASDSGLCRTCRLAPPPFTKAVAYGLYEGGMREAIHALKYSGLHPAARVLGHMLAQAFAKLAAEAPAEMLVVPVPLHRSKYAQRGFNQARALAEEAIKSLRKTHPAWRLALESTTLLRLRSTESQAGLTPRQRRQNVRGAFTVAEGRKITDRHILLVDDILTTGATARAAAQTMLRAGAASVWVATLARARRHGAPGGGQIEADEGEASARLATVGVGSYRTGEF